MKDIVARSPRSKVIWIGAVGGVAASAVFLWLALRDVDLGEVRAALGNAEPMLVALGVCAMGGMYLFQTLRWRVIAHTPSVPARRFFEMVVSAVACNNVLPARLGDVFRARWLAREANVSGGRALASVVLDRGSDLAVLVVLLLSTTLSVSTAPWLDRIAVVGLAALVVLVAVVLFSRSYTVRNDRARHASRSRLRRVIRDTVEGLALPLRPREITIAAALSVMAWCTWALGAWLVARSVGVELSVVEALFVTAAINLGVAVPSSPGFVGTYQWLGIATLGLFGVVREEALAFAILLQAVWYLPTTLAGGLFLVLRLARRGAPRRLVVRAAESGE